MGAKVTRQELIDDMLKVYNSLNRAPLTTEYENLGKYTVQTFRKEFGKWRDVLLSCGIQPTEDNRKLNTDADILTELERLSSILGRAPTYTDIKKLSTVSPDTIARRTGRTGYYDPQKILDDLDATWSVDNINPEDGAWISGFTTGEGCFIIKGSNVSFSLSQRADDISNLEFVRDVMGIPKDIYKYSNSTRRSQGQKAGDEARFYVTNRWVCKVRVVPFFDRFQLKGRKKLDYEIFRSAVMFLCERDALGRYHQRLNDREKRFLLDLEHKLKTLRHDPTSLMV